MISIDAGRSEIPSSSSRSRIILGSLARSASIVSASVTSPLMSRVVATQTEASGSQSAWMTTGRAICNPLSDTIAPSGALDTRRRSKLQRLCQLHLGQSLHLGEHVGRQLAVDLDEGDGLTA